MFYTTGDPGTDVMVCFVRMPVLISAAWFVPIAVLNADSGTDVGSGLYQEGRLPLHLVCASQKLSRSYALGPYAYVGTGLEVCWYSTGVRHTSTMPPCHHTLSTVPPHQHSTTRPSAQKLSRSYALFVPYVWMRCMDREVGGSLCL